MINIFNIISLFLPIFLLVGLLLILIGLIGLITAKIRQYKNQGHMIPKRKWWNLLIAGIILCVITIGLFYVINLFRLQPVPEERGKVSVSQTPEVQALIQKYGKKEYLLTH